MPNKAIIRKVNELKIRCTNHREGCGWVGELGRLKSHLDSDKGCGYVEVTCTNKGCGERVSRKDLQTHLKEKCYYRPYECEYCGHKDTYTAITGRQKNPECLDHSPGSPLAKKARYTDHYSECPEYPLACPNRCDVTGIRCRAMPDHHSSCPLEPLNCPFKDAGCNEKIARNDMEDHMTAGQEKHIQSLQQLKQNFDTTKLELDATKQELDTTKEKLQNTKQELWLVNVGLRSVGDTLTLRVTDFPQLKKERKAWRSPPFILADQVRVHLVVYFNGKHYCSHHVSVSLILVEVVERKKNPPTYSSRFDSLFSSSFSSSFSNNTLLKYNVSIYSITAKGQNRSAPPKTLELCTQIRKGNTVQAPACSARFPLPSPGKVLRSVEQFLKIEEANSLLQNDAMILELKLLEHKCHPPPPPFLDDFFLDEVLSKK